MKIACKEDGHGLRIHDCVEKIINAFKQGMLQVPRKDKVQSIALTCRQVNDILDYAAKATYHPAECTPEWESVVYRHEHNLMCGKCGSSFKNMVIEKARRLTLL